MTAIRPNFGDLLMPGFREIFQDKFKERPPEYSKLFNVMTSDRQYEDDSAVTGFGTVPLKTEGAGIAYDDPMQGFNTRYTHNTYGLGFRVTREMWEDDMYGKMKKMPKALARSVRITVEQDGANVYNRAFNSSYVGGDGLELCSTAHPLVGGGTEQNELTTGADLNTTSLEQALIDIAATVDDRGLLVALEPKLLVVAPANDWNASKILQSSQEPETGNNAINPAKGRLPYTVNHYLSNSDDWFILCDDHEVNWFWRRRPEFDKGNDFDTEDAKYKATARWSNGWSEWRGVFGSPGI